MVLTHKLIDQVVNNPSRNYVYIVDDTMKPLGFIINDFMPDSHFQQQGDFLGKLLRWRQFSQKAIIVQ